MEGDLVFICTPICTENFNPLPPHGGRPYKSKAMLAGFAFQSTPSAWRETGRVQCAVVAGNISIHSLRMEGDPAFLLFALWIRISIHSLRMEGDVFPKTYIVHVSHFNPLPPHGGRHQRTAGKSLCAHFNPLPPHGGRPVLTSVAGLPEVISIHSLRMEGDVIVI